MCRYVLSFKPSVGHFGSHDPSAVLMKGDEIIFGVEEERLTRVKHAKNTFPTRSIQQCIEYADISLSQLDKIVLPYKPPLESEILSHSLNKAAFHNSTVPRRLYGLQQVAVNQLTAHLAPTATVERRLKQQFGGPLPQIETKAHHRCHAASAFHPSGFDEALVLTIDGKGEYDSTVVWKATESQLNRVKTFEVPNSLGRFYGTVTEFLGFRAFNGEGKVMGLAPYGEKNPKIERTLRRHIDTSADYDVTAVTTGSLDSRIDALEDMLDRTRRDKPVGFTQWEKDLAFTTQKLLEEIVTNVVEKYVSVVPSRNVALSGGVALNCKMNRMVREMDAVSDVFIQPVSNDAGLAIGGCMLEHPPSKIATQTDAYFGAAYTNKQVEELLETNKIEYKRVDNVAKRVAGELADGKLVGWFQGRMEMGPRALGNRSILADPRSLASRDRVNKYVKHREEWRPFAPSILAEAAEEYLENPSESPFMIDTFSIREERRGDIKAILHAGDNTTRPQTVSEEQNPRYYELISAFEDETGVPVVLNTSFNDHGEPIVERPSQAVKDFYGMGLDVLAIEDVLVYK